MGSRVTCLERAIRKYYKDAVTHKQQHSRVNLVEQGIPTVVTCPLHFFELMDLAPGPSPGLAAGGAKNQKGGATFLK